MAVMGLGVGRMGAARTKGGGLSDLLQLFRGGEDGFLFYPQSDLTRLFLVSTGTTGNVAADADPTGLDLDNHAWASRSYSQQVAQSTELVSNGGFASGTGWTAEAGWSIGAGVATCASGITNLYQSGILTSGLYYLVTLDITAYTSGALAIIGGAAVSGLGSKSVIIKASSANLVLNSGSFVGSIDNVSAKLIAGNHGQQATSTKRPLWNANSGKPYLSYDGVDDFLSTPFVIGAAATLAASFYVTAADGELLGGGATTGNLRAFLGIDTTGKLCGAWGAQNQGVILGGSDVRNANHVGLITADATSVDLYLDGALIYTGAPSGSPSGNTNACYLGAWNNAGSVVGPLTGREYAALALNRRVTPAEIALITSKFQGAYQ